MTAAMSSDRTRLSRNESGHSPVAINCASPLHDCSLANARLADQNRIVLLAACEDLHDALDLLCTADRRIQLTIRRQLCEIPAEMIQRRSLGFLLALCRGWGRRYTARRGCAASLRKFSPEQAQGFLARLIEIDPGIRKHLRSDPLLFAKKTEEEMFGTNVRVIELTRFSHRKLEHLLGTRSIRKVRASGRRGGSPAKPQRRSRRRSAENRRDREEGKGRDAFAFANQPEQYV